MAAPSPPPIAPGAEIGPYRLETELGQGGMGRVFRARDSRLGRVVALKFIRPEHAADEVFRQRFIREARTLSTLNHPHVCALYDILDHHGSPCLVMEYVEGQSLADVLAARPPSPDDVRRLATEIAAALAAAHERGIVHRDLKPGNIMVTPHGAKVLDFGLAREAAPPPEGETQSLSMLTVPGRIVGTPPYMSPEQVAGRPLDARSDVFAAGAIVYEMLTGERPFQGATGVETMAAILQATPKPLSGFNRAIPRDLIGVVNRCLQKAPDDRYASGRELEQALRSGVPAPGSASKAWWVAAACIALLVAGAAVLGWSRYRTATRTAWVNDVAVPEISRLIEADRGLAARALFDEAERAAPAASGLIRVAEGVAARPVTIESTPPAADLYISDYAADAGDDLSTWRRLGTTPVTAGDIPTWGYYRVRAVKAGFATTDVILGAAALQVTQRLSIELPAAAGAPPGMVWVPATSEPAGGPALPAYWLGRYEVTNAEFKRFVDAGGYQKAEYWTEPVRKDGRTLSRTDAMALFRDRTGRPGPATWELSGFPPGAEQLPVSGVSWYEAMAYAAFAGEALPSLYEWRRAAGTTENANVVLLSNFGAKGPEAVGTRHGMSPFGSFDMAGNVKEWTSTARDDAFYVLGGGWDEPAYGFNNLDFQPPLLRDANVGFRIIKRLSPPPAALFSAPPAPPLPVPVTPTDAEYRVYAGLHRQEPVALDARLERTVDTSPYWRRETASVLATYPDERVLVHVFLPRHVPPPYPAVVVLGGSTVSDVIRRVEDFDYPFEFIVRSGRAAVIPALSGTLERGPTPPGLTPGQLRDRFLRWSADIGQTLAYLDGRPDIDHQRLGLYAISNGAVHAVRFMAVHPRFRAGVLSSGGWSSWLPPEVNALNFAAHVRTPVLMVNGRYDTIFPVESNQLPLFRALGAAAADKRHVLYDGGHRNLVTRPDLIGEVLDWFDRYLGPAPSS
ncbi:MAG: protein kinase [Vicinamibacterales bacterium]